MVSCQTLTEGQGLEGGDQGKRQLWRSRSWWEGQRRLLTVTGLERSPVGEQGRPLGLSSHICEMGTGEPARLRVFTIGQVTDLYIGKEFPIFF